jgi:hypothetical protein
LQLGLLGSAARALPQLGEEEEEEAPQLTDVSRLSTRTPPPRPAMAHSAWLGSGLRPL